MQVVKSCNDPLLALMVELCGVLLESSSDIWIWSLINIMTKKCVVYARQLVNNIIRSCDVSLLTLIISRWVSSGL